jgi:hypothetical protein
VVAADHATGQLSTWHFGVGPATLWAVHAAELLAIGKAVDVIGQRDKDGDEDESRERNNEQKCVTIASDSQSTIQAIANPRSTSGQGIVRRILHQVKALRTRRIKMRLHWVPGPRLSLPCRQA